MTDEKMNAPDAEDTAETVKTESEKKPEKAKKEDKKDAKEAEKTTKKEAAAAEKHKKEIEKLEDELAEQKDKYLRMMAEYDNFRRRAAKERDGAYADAYADALEAVLPVMDNLERAAAYSGGDPEKVTKGVQLTLDSFKAMFDKLGIEEIAAEPGIPFDPQLHNAVMHAEDESFGENEIAEVFAKGYKMGDKVIRHSMVKVAN